MEVPNDYICPLTNVLMRNPMIDSEAFVEEQQHQAQGEESLSLCPSYERSAILSKLEEDFRSGKRSYCPVTGLPVSMDCLVLNKPLRWKIKYWAKKNYGSFEEAAAVVASSKQETRLKADHSSSHHSTSSCNSITSFAPEQFLCPLSQTIMEDPVTSRDGSATFERNIILKWLDSSLSELCPVTDQVLTRKDLVRNDKLATQIQEWKKQRQQLQGELERA
jgi:hypothetical protein